MTVGSSGKSRKMHSSPQDHVRNAAVSVYDAEAKPQDKARSVNAVARASITFQVG